MEIQKFDFEQVRPEDIAFIERESAKIFERLGKIDRKLIYEICNAGEMDCIELLPDDPEHAEVIELYAKLGAIGVFYEFHPELTQRLPLAEAS